MFIYAIGLLSFSIIYWVNLISNDRWDELTMRIIVMVLTIGSVCCFALAKILHNQKIILDILNNKDKQKSD
jgi:heme/copper-type cytochrome/quinol oxidase subunit 1